MNTPEQETPAIPAETEDEALPEPSIEAIPPEKIPPAPERPVSRARGFLRNLLRWTLSLLIAFGLGALTVYFTLLQPTQQDLEQSLADLEAAGQEISDLEGQISDLEGQIDELNSNNQELQDKLEIMNIQLVLLDTLSEVRAASLALAADDYAGARLALDKATGSLETLSTLLEDEQSEVIAAMQESIHQAMVSMKDDFQAAIPELDRLAVNLISLKGTLLTNP